MKKRILSFTLALCLGISSQSVAYAQEEDSSLQEDVLTEETTEESDADDDVITVPQEDPLLQEDVLTEENVPQEDALLQEDVLMEETTEESDADVITVPQEDPSLQEDVITKETTFGLITRDSTISTPTEIYEAMLALKNQDAYKDGTTWTDYEPYSDSAGYYHWHGGTLDGTNIVAVGCVAFAFILSDAAFGSLPARMYAKGEFSFEDIKVGDILRVNNDTHTVIVLEVSDVGVVVAEGNNSGKVRWGRAISKEDVMSSASHYITRYPDDYVSPDDPTANDIIVEGIIDEGLTWELTKAGTLTISGSGAMPDFSGAGEQPWSDKSSQIRKVVIGDGVTSIGSSAFWGCGVLSVEISSSVTTIGNSAFRGSSIISVTIPASVKTIDDSAFRECENLSSVTICEGVETIGQNAFRACAGLTSIALPASIGEVGDAAFFQCTAMISATFAPGSKQVKLGDNMFTECYYLMSVTLPSSIDCIGEGMFQNCKMLAGVEIPQGAESIGASAFASCYSFTTVIIPDSVTEIGIAAFSASSLTDIYFTGTEEQWNKISKIGDTASAVSKATIHYNYIPAVSPDPDDDNTGNNTDDDSNGEKPGNNSGNTSSGSNPGSSSSGNAISNKGSNSDTTESNPMALSIINSGIKAVIEIWEPTTPDEIKRYACMGKEAIGCTLSKDNAYQIEIENAMQGPMCFKSFEAVLGDYTIGRTYNIYPLSDAAYSMDKEIQFTIEIPSAIYKEDREYKMICVTKGGQPIIYNDLDSDPETITIKTNKFYAYALVYKQKQS